MAIVQPGTQCPMVRAVAGNGTADGFRGNGGRTVLLAGGVSIRGQRSLPTGSGVPRAAPLIIPSPTGEARPGAGVIRDQLTARAPFERVRGKPPQAVVTLGQGMAPLGDEPAETEKRSSRFDDERPAPSGCHSPQVSWDVLPGKGDRQMPRRTPATWFYDKLALQLAPRRAPRNSGPQSGKTQGTLSDPSNERTGAPEPNVGALLYLVSLGVVAIATVVVFFGLGFFLLIHPNEVLIAGARDRGIEVEPRRTDPGSPEKDAATLTVQTELPNPAAASAGSVAPGQPPEAREVLPPADRDTAWASLPASAADMVAANATSDAPSSRELRALRDEATLATPGGVTHAKRTGIGRRRHDGARKHWTGVSRPGANGRPAPAASGLEEVRRWIVQSAIGILAALSPPPPRQSSGFKTH